VRAVRRSVSFFEKTHNDNIKTTAKTTAETLHSSGEKLIGAGKIFARFDVKNKMVLERILTANERICMFKKHNI
jgi:hypothetical protein